MKSEQKLSNEMHWAAEKLNDVIQEAQTTLGKPVYLEIASREGFVRVTPILYPVALFTSQPDQEGLLESAEQSYAAAKTIRQKMDAAAAISRALES